MGVSKIIEKYIDDVLILGGLAAIVAATFMLSVIAGIYAFGVCMLALGVWFAKNPIQRG